MRMFVFETLNQFHVLSQFHNLTLASKKLVFLSVILMTTVSIKEKIVKKFKSYGESERERERSTQQSFI